MSSSGLGSQRVCETELTHTKPDGELISHLYTKLVCEVSSTESALVTVNDHRIEALVVSSLLSNAIERFVVPFIRNIVCVSHGRSPIRVVDQSL
jgi:hypothetical protein